MMGDEKKVDHQLFEVFPREVSLNHQIQAIFLTKVSISHIHNTPICILVHNTQISEATFTTFHKEYSSQSMNSESSFFMPPQSSITPVIIDKQCSVLTVSVGGRHYLFLCVILWLVFCRIHFLLSLCDVLLVSQGLFFKIILLTYITF